MTRLAATFSIAAGAAIFFVWVVLLATGNVPELASAPSATMAHILAECLTGMALVGAGIGLLRAALWALWLYLAATGMLVYATVQAAGYYLDRSLFPASAGLIAIALLALWLCFGVLRTKR